MAEAGLGWKTGYGFLVTFILVTVTVSDVCLGLGRSKKADATPFFWMQLGFSFMCVHLF